MTTAETRPSADRYPLVLILVIIALVGSLGARMGWGTTRIFSGSPCRAGTLPCTIVGEFLLTWAAPMVVVVATALAVVGVVRADKRWSGVALATWLGYCLLWWTIHLTS